MSLNRSALAAVVVIPLASFLSGCVSENSLPPVFGAVFGLKGATTAPFVIGTIPDPVVRSGDRVIGTAANNPGQCIYFRGTSDRRFRADCPEGYDL